VGALGFANAAEELSGQLAEAGIDPELVVIAVGSGASCAGLQAGRLKWPLLGISVSRPISEITPTVHRLAADCAIVLEAPSPNLDRMEIVDAIGPGYGVASAQDLIAEELALCTEGLLLEHTYTAKAMAVLLRRVRAGMRGPVVFWHTGGPVPEIGVP
jgi:D-cysteine desulfhydrase